jgi:enolase
MDACNVGDEGGFAPNILENREALELIKTAIAKAGATDIVKIGMDVAASEFFKDGVCVHYLFSLVCMVTVMSVLCSYDLDFKNPDSAPESKISGAALADMYRSFIADYPIVSIEDPFDQDDFDSYTSLTASVKEQIVRAHAADGRFIALMLRFIYFANSEPQVGDDLLVTNPTRIQTGIDRKACNALLLKVNQIGTVSESIKAALLAFSAGWGTMVSHRSGETEDTFIADLVVGLGTGQIKTGAPCRGERLAKCARLMSQNQVLFHLCAGTTSCCASRKSWAQRPSSLESTSGSPNKTAAQRLGELSGLHAQPRFPGLLRLLPHRL